MSAMKTQAMWMILCLLAACRTGLLDEVDDLGAVDLARSTDAGVVGKDFGVDAGPQKSTCPQTPTPGGACTQPREYCEYRPTQGMPVGETIACICSTTWACQTGGGVTAMSSGFCSMRPPVASRNCRSDFAKCTYCDEGGTQGISCSCVDGERPVCFADFSCGG